MEIQHFITKFGAEKAASAYVAKLNADFAYKLNNPIEVITKNIAGEALIEDFKQKVKTVDQDGIIEVTDTSIIIENLSGKKVSLEFSDYNLSSLTVPMKEISFDEECKIRQTKLFLVAAIYSLLPQYELRTADVTGYSLSIFTSLKDFLENTLKDYYYHYEWKRNNDNGDINEYPTFSCNLLLREYYHVKFHESFEPANHFTFSKKRNETEQSENHFDISSWG